ncbi:MAG: DUF4352 domain-containing protein [Thermomicrobiales bacterium]
MKNPLADGAENLRRTHPGRHASHAACGDDDDDDTDVIDDVDASPTIEMTVTDGTGEGTETMVDEGTVATEADMEMTGTEEDSDNGTSTETDSGMTGTATEEDSAMGTSTESDDDMTGTATEEDDSDMTGTATEEDSAMGTSTEEDSEMGTSTETDDDATSTEADDDASATESGSSEDTAGIGDPVDVEGFTITVEGVETIIGVPGVLEPGSDHQFVALTMTIENTGGDPLSLLSALGGVYLETGDGEQYGVDLRANAVLLFEGDGIAAARIESNSEATGKVGFEIPEDVDELMLVVENDATGNNVMIDLTDEFAS